MAPGRREALGKYMRRRREMPPTAGIYQQERGFAVTTILIHSLNQSHIHPRAQQRASPRAPTLDPRTAAAQDVQSRGLTSESRACIGHEYLSTRPRLIVSSPTRPPHHGIPSPRLAEENPLAVRPFHVELLGVVDEVRYIPAKRARARRRERAKRGD